MRKETVPFAILSIIHILLLGYTIYKKKQETLILLFSSIGITYVFEYFVLNVFNMYSYSPKVFKNRWMDTQFGGLLSQAIFVPIRATYFTAFDKGWKNRIATTVVFAGVERLFIHWGIYKNRTWKTYYTLLLLPCYFWIVSKWWSGLQNNVGKIKTATLVFCYWIHYINSYFILVAIFKKFLIRSIGVQNKYWNHFLLSPIYTLFISVIGAANSLFMKRLGKIIGLLFIHISDHIMYKCNKIHTNNWSVYAFLPLHVFMLFLGEYSYALIKKISE